MWSCLVLQTYSFISLLITISTTVSGAWQNQGHQRSRRWTHPPLPRHNPRQQFHGKSSKIICHQSSNVEATTEGSSEAPIQSAETKRVSITPMATMTSGGGGSSSSAAGVAIFHPETSASQAEQAVASLAATTVALLAGNEQEALELSGGAANKRQMIHDAFRAYDVCESGTLSVEEAKALFTNLARSIVVELASSHDDGSDDTHGNDATKVDDREVSSSRSFITKSKSKPRATRDVARSHAARVLAADEAGDTIARVATKLLLLADTNGDGKVSLTELAEMFETVQKAPHVETFPRPLRALAGSLQLLPPTEGTNVIEASNKTAQWNVGVPGDDHTLRRVVLIQDQLSVVGLGRSADASAYFLPELGIVLDAGIHVKSLAPKLVLLTHGHRDHIAALPTHTQSGATILTPAAIAPMVRRFLLAEAQLNYGDPTQTDEETIAALGEFKIQGVEDGYEQLLPKDCYMGSPTPVGVQVFEAPHKNGVPAVSYGLYRTKNRLKPVYANLPKHELGALLRNDVVITESYNEGILFYTGDTTISLLRNRWKDILPKYKYMIHEVTFLGQPSTKLDQSTLKKGHTHYAQLHPWICAFPETTFICVHWSLRYSKEEILTFFEDQYGGVPKNVVLWL
jgi:ribonuclease Z